MQSDEQVAELRVDDEAFLVASTIERCPKTMMLRELMMNAVEAARLAAEGRRSIEISSLEFNGYPKLTIWNTGPGMDDRELRSMCDLAASIGKEKSLDGNFGMGAKVASLPSNQHGMRYRSCKNGRVHEVILCKRNGVYGRLRRHDLETDAWIEVADVTEIAVTDGRSVEEDWTEVVLLGNHETQDTVSDPFDGDPVLEGQWLATYLYHRFYRLPSGVRVQLLEGTHKLDGTRQFETIPGRLRFFERYEAVEAEGGLRIHYFYDAPYERASGHNRSISGALASAVSTCAIVYRNEMFDVRKGRAWTLDAPIFGIPFGGRHISIHVELPDNFPVRPESYRQFLRYVSGEQGQVYAQDFAEIVRKHRPNWLIEIIRSFAPESASSEDIRAELQKLLNDLRVIRNSPRVKANGAVRVGRGDLPGVEPTGIGNTDAPGEGGRFRHTRLSVLPTGARRASYSNMERAPEIVRLRTDEEIEDKQLKERAGRYYSETGILFVNMQYPSIAAMREVLEKEYAGAPDVEAMRGMVLEISEHTMILRVGRGVVYALAKQINKEWDQDAVAKALSPESLSLAADDFLDSLQTARRRIGISMRATKQPMPADHGGTEMGDNAA